MDSAWVCSSCTLKALSGLQAGTPDATRFPRNRAGRGIAGRGIGLDIEIGDDAEMIAGKDAVDGLVEGEGDCRDLACGLGVCVPGATNT